MTAFRGLVLFSLLFVASCAPEATKEVPQEFKAGQKYYHKVCSNCHGADAMGKHTQAPRLIDAEYIEENFSDEEFSETIIHGINKMPSQRSKLTDEEIAEIIKYLRYSQKIAGLVVEEDVEEEMLNDEDAQ
ncbi:MAG: hypothetical protein NPINA01_28090 [Nitrospinaceae bacterium]|nr:MAG: hypothetical protein NPINA01_28090 [Nitrospinaceae bacterium]